MNRANLAAWLAGITLALLLLASQGYAQATPADSLHRRQVVQLTDSARRLIRNTTTCRTAACLASVRQLLTRVDSLETARLTSRPPAPVASVGIQLEAITRTHYASGLGVWDPRPSTDTVTVCAVVHDASHRERVGWPPVRIRVLGDSAVMGTRFGNPLESMCGPALRGILTVADSVPVSWSLEWFTRNGRRILRPVAVVVR